MKTTTVVCEVCNKSFDKPTNEYNRSIRVGRKFFCSRSCSGTAYVSHLKKYAGQYTSNLISGSSKDDYSDFRVYLRRSRNRFKEVSVTLDDLKRVWDNQSGICVYTGVKLIRPSETKENDPNYTASLDRIDSSKGYVKGNIQFISMAANYAKNKMTHEKMLEFCKILQTR
jgi:hypothetical protein